MLQTFKPAACTMTSVRRYSHALPREWIQGPCTVNTRCMQFVRSKCARHQYGSCRGIAKVLLSKQTYPWNAVVTEYYKKTRKCLKIMSVINKVVARTECSGRKCDLKTYWLLDPYRHTWTNSQWTQDGETLLAWNETMWAYNCALRATNIHNFYINAVYFTACLTCWNATWSYLYLL